MARIRTVKPDLFRHLSLYNWEKTAKLPLRLAFIGLFTAADRAGRFKWSPKELKLDCLPYDDNVDFELVLKYLVEGGFIVRYEVDGREYGCIPSWESHQVINNREQDSKIPAMQGIVDACPTRDPRPLIFPQGEGKGREGKGRDNTLSKPTPLAAAPESGFNFFGHLCEALDKAGAVITERSPITIGRITAKGKKVGESVFRGTVERYCKDEYCAKAGLSLNGFINSFDRLATKAKGQDYFDGQRKAEAMAKVAKMKF